MSVDPNDLIARAKAEAERAVEEEHGDGDALQAALHYVRAVELLTLAMKHFRFASEASEHYVRFQVFEKIEEYRERAALYVSISTPEEIAEFDSKSKGGSGAPPAPSPAKPVEDGAEEEEEPAAAATEGKDVSEPPAAGAKEATKDAPKEKNASFDRVYEEFLKQSRDEM